MLPVVKREYLFEVFTIYRFVGEGKLGKERGQELCHILEGNMAIKGLTAVDGIGWERI